jgi:addiction module RelE/StbE family toxin
MYTLVPSKRVIKVLRKCQKSGVFDPIVAYERACALLAVFNASARFVLREQWRDHALKGSLKDCRELHLGFDLLLIYRVHESEGIIELTEIMTHDELSKQKR